MVATIEVGKGVVQAASKMDGVFIPHMLISPGSYATDPFGHNRVSNQEKIFESKQIFDNGPLFWDDVEIAGGAGTSSTYSKPHARTQLADSATTAGKRVRQTFMRFNYHTGNGQLIILTGVLGMPATGITQEIGYFDDDNGIFFQCAGGALNIVIRSSVTGSPVDTVFPQSDWSEDKLDGKGPSGATLDPAMLLIFWIDFEWLGSGTVRAGFFIDGVPVIAHKAHHANKSSVVYMSTPNLPIRYSIENDGTGAATTLDHLCSTVISDGGLDRVGIVRHASSNGNTLDAAATATVYALIGIRLKSTHLAATVEMINVGVAEFIGTKQYTWQWLLNPSVAGTFTYADETNGAVQNARAPNNASDTIATGGTHLGGGLGSSASRGEASTSAIESSLRLGSKIDGTPDEMVLAVVLRDGDINGDFEGSILWRELV